MSGQLDLTTAHLLLMGAQWTVGLTVASFLLGAAIALIITVTRTFGGRISNSIATLFTETIQATPVLMLLFMASFGLSYLGFRLPVLVAVIAALSLLGAAFLGEIWSSSVKAVPKEQWQAGDALAMTSYQQCRYILGPQAFRIALAPTVGFIVQLVKNTSIASLVGFMELTRMGTQINTMSLQPLLIFSIVAVIYFALCYPLSLFSYRLEKSLNVDR